LGSAVYAPAELKTIQEVVTLVVFAASPRSISTSLSWMQGVGFALIALGAALVFCGQSLQINVASKPRTAAAVGSQAKR
jgi:uncharacterized protein (DUF486 family)